MVIGDNVYTAAGLFITLGLMVLGLIAAWPAVNAFKKGRNFAKWYVFSVLLFPAALIASFAIKPRLK